MRLKRPDAIEMIKGLQLFSAVRDKAELLLDFDRHFIQQSKRAKGVSEENLEVSITTRDLASGPAVQLLVQSTDAIPVL